VVEHLLAYADLIVDTRNINGELPQHLAAQGGSVDVAKLLISDGRFDFGKLNETGENSLHRACAGEMVPYLLSLPCIDPNLADENGATALHFAAWSGSKRVSLLLADPRVDVTPVDKQGKQPIHWAAEYWVNGPGLEALKTLIDDPRIDPWVKTVPTDPSQKGEDVLQLAIESRTYQMYEYLKTLWNQKEELLCVDLNIVQAVD
jgi:Ankyrin repeats (3 copies)